MLLKCVTKQIAITYSKAMLIPQPIVVVFYFTDAALGFSSTNVASIEENTAAETLIMQVAAAGGTDPNVYTITATTPVELAGWFEIVDTDKLRIKTGATIDYEHANLPVGKTVVIELT